MPPRASTPMAICSGIPMSDPFAQAQAAEEVYKQLSREATAEHRIECIAAYGRARERQALERAAMVLEDKARQLYAVASATASTCAGSHAGIDAAHQLDIESATLRDAAATLRALIGGE
jgi:hypothetical protein